MKIEQSYPDSLTCSFQYDPVQLYFTERSRRTLEMLQAVAEKDPAVPKVIAIYGNSGSGKTSLLKRFITELRTLRPNESLLYLSSEELLTDLLLQLSRDRAAECMQQYARYTTLVVDNIDALAGKKSTLGFLLRVSAKMDENSHLILISGGKKAGEALEPLQPACYELSAAEEIEAKLAYAKDLIRSGNMQSHIKDEYLHRIITLPIPGIRSALLRCCALPPDAGPEEIMKVYRQEERS